MCIRIEWMQSWEILYKQYKFKQLVVVVYLWYIDYWKIASRKLDSLWDVIQDARAGSDLTNINQSKTHVVQTYIVQARGIWLNIIVT